MKTSSQKFDVELPYTVTLDDDAVVCDLIEAIVGVKTFRFKSLTELTKQHELLHPIGAFVDVHLAHGECGIDIIPNLKRLWPQSPIIVMTSDDNEHLITQALAAGAHDFILKPLRPSEVVARLNTRRFELSSRIKNSRLTFADLVVDFDHKTVTGPKGQTFLSSREIKILEFLIHGEGTVIEKDAIRCQVWGSISVSENALDRKLFEVRRALREVSDIVELKSVYGRGVQLRSKNFDEDRVLLDDMEVVLSKLSPKAPSPRTRITHEHQHDKHDG